MIYRKLHRTWSHGYANYIPGFIEKFPELRDVDSQILCDRFIDLGLDFYCETGVKSPWWIRLTLPVTLLVFAVMFLSLPIVYIITGHWGTLFVRRIEYLIGLKL